MFVSLVLAAATAVSSGPAPVRTATLEVRARVEATCTVSVQQPGVCQGAQGFAPLARRLEGGPNAPRLTIEY